MTIESQNEDGTTTVLRGVPLDLRYEVTREYAPIYTISSLEPTPMRVPGRRTALVDMRVMIAEEEVQETTPERVEEFNRWKSLIEELDANY